MKPKVHKTVYEAVQVRLLHQLFLSYAVCAAAYDNFDKSNWRKWIFCDWNEMMAYRRQNNKMECICATEAMLKFTQVGRHYNRLPTDTTTVFA